MNTLPLILFHLKVFAAVAVIMYAVVIVRNAIFLFGPPVVEYSGHRLACIRQAIVFKKHAQRAVESIRMPGRTRPVNDFYSFVHDT